MRDGEVMTFKDDDGGYLAWASASGGYVLKQRSTKAYMLHHSRCSHLGAFDDPAVRITRKLRVCADSVAALDIWLRRAGNATRSVCRSCGASPI